jgi:hypothetical protein
MRAEPGARVQLAAMAERQKALDEILNGMSKRQQGRQRQLDDQARSAGACARAAG